MNLSDRIAKLETRLMPPGDKEVVVWMDVGRQSEGEIEAAAFAACQAQGIRASAENTWVLAHAIVEPSESGPVTFDRPLKVTQVRRMGW